MNWKNRKIWIGVVILIIFVIFLFSILFGVSGIKNFEESKDTSIYKSYQEGSQVNISMEKTNYSPGREIHFEAEIDGTVYFWPDGGWSIYRKVEEGWKLTYGSGCGAYYPDCSDIKFDGTDYCHFRWCERAYWYKTKTGTHYSDFKWDQRRSVGTRQYNCTDEDVLGHKSEKTHRCFVLKQVPSGKYKVRFEYTSDKPEDMFSPRGVDVKYAEKEFTIS